MRMFLGEYQPNITEGSRLALPKKIRDQIRGEEVILSKGFERCVFVYDKEDWIKESQKQVDTSITDPKNRDLKRYMFAGATESAIDVQGRIVLPGTLKTYAGLSKKTTIIGAGDHIEIWDTDEWNVYLQKITAGFANDAE